MCVTLVTVLVKTAPNTCSWQHTNQGGCIKVNTFRWMKGRKKIIAPCYCNHFSPSKTSSSSNWRLVWKCSIVKVMLYPGSTLTTQEHDSKCGKPLPGDWLMMTPVDAVRTSFMGHVTVKTDPGQRQRENVKNQACNNLRSAILCGRRHGTCCDFQFHSCSFNEPGGIHRIVCAVILLKDSSFWIEFWIIAHG